MTFAILLGIVVLITVLVLAQYRTHLLQYLWFCRFPLLVGAILIALPLLALRVFPAMLRNMLVLDPPRLFQLAFWATIAAWTVMWCLALIVEGAPIRTGLPFERETDRKSDPPSRVLTKAADWIEVALLRGRDSLICAKLAEFELRALFFYLILGFPMVFAAVSQSRGEGEDWRIWGMLFFGPLGAWVFRFVYVDRFIDLLSYLFLGKLDESGSPRRRKGTLSEVWRRGLTGFDRHLPREIAANQVRAVLFFVSVLMVYFIGYYAERPDQSAYLEVPAMGFVLALLVLVCMVLTFLTFFFDIFRVPVVALLIVISFLGSWSTNQDHEFPAVVIPRDSVSSYLPDSAYSDWRATRPGWPMTVVAASGGGITASYWTARVLTGLQQDTYGLLGRSLILVSTVSGGSVGGMYFVDRYRPGGLPTSPATLDSILVRSGSSSLQAAAWGLVYPDLWRAFGWTEAPTDRGWAIEQPWRQRLTGSDTTLLQWRRGVAEGWRPIQIFNATVVETGERMTLSPLTLSEWRRRGSRDLGQISSRLDVPVTTAARLSATFPFVTPVARPPEIPPPDSWNEADTLERKEYLRAQRREYHLADGGYYDNFGVVTAVDFLDRLLGRYRAEGQDSVLFIKIALSDLRAPLSKDRRGWVHAAVGPLLTMLNVRTSAQVGRNDLETQLLIDRWRERGVEVVVVEFRLDDDEAPLSWHLTWREQCKANRQWHNGEEVLKARRKVLSFYGPQLTIQARPVDCSLEERVRQRIAARAANEEAPPP